jgi:hypothetical protein
MAVPASRSLGKQSDQLFPGSRILPKGWLIKHEKRLRGQHSAPTNAFFTDRQGEWISGSKTVESEPHQKVVDPLSGLGKGWCSWIDSQFITHCSCDELVLRILEDRTTGSKLTRFPADEPGAAPRRRPRFARSTPAAGGIRPGKG